MRPRMQVIFILPASRNVMWIWEQEVVKNTEFPETVSWFADGAISGHVGCECRQRCSSSCYGWLLTFQVSAQMLPLSLPLWEHLKYTCLLFVCFCFFRIWLIILFLAFTEITKCVKIILSACCLLPCLLPTPLCEERYHISPLLLRIWHNWIAGA